MKQNTVLIITLCVRSENVCMLDYEGNEELIMIGKLGGKSVKAFDVWEVEKEK